MRKVLALLLGLLIPVAGWATKTVSPSNGTLNPGITRFSFVSGDSGNFDVVPTGACGSLVFGFEAATGGAATVSACSDSSCTSTSTVASFVADVSSTGALSVGWGYLRVEVDTAPSSGTAVVSVRCGKEVAAVRSAPGLVGSLGTDETFYWVAGLTEAPFSELADPPGGRTKYYFSPTSGGLWPAGNDSNDGLTPATAKSSMTGTGGWKDTCFDTTVHCILDSEGFTVGNGYGDLGIIANADIDDRTGCPTDYIGALRSYPCLRWSCAEGQSCAIDGNGSTGSGTPLTFSPITRTTLLLEGISIVADGTSGGLTALDCQEAGIIFSLGADHTTLDPNGASVNVISAHDDCLVVKIGGTGGYSGTQTQAGPLLATQGSGAVSVITLEALTGAATSTVGHVVALVQSGGSMDASLNPLTRPAAVLVYGATLDVPSGNTHASSAPLTFSTDDGASVSETYTESVDGTFINTYFLQQSGSATNRYHIVCGNFVGGSGDADLVFIHSTMSDTSTLNDWNVFCSTTQHADTDDIDLIFAGHLWGRIPTNAQYIRWVDPSFVDGGISTIALVDGVYDGGENNAWRFWYAATSCQEATPAALQTCVNAQSSGMMTVTNVTDGGETAQYTGNGFCANAADCDGLITIATTGSYYIKQFDERFWLPQWIAGPGRTITGYISQTSADAGRIGG